MKQLVIGFATIVVLIVAGIACTSPVNQPVNQPARQPQTGTGVQQGRQDQTQPQVPGNQPAPDNQPVPDNNDDRPQGNAQFKLTGIWYSRTATAYGTLSTQLLLEPTGTFSQQSTLGDLLTYDVGTYVVGEGYIHFTVTDHQPKVYRNQPMQWVTSFTYFITPVDQNTMQVEDRIVNTHWVMYRQ
ncbi:MAG: hypothetical protein HZB53_01095 [Chloroflexi bacterium]|nr:hypothetical protein [Chloroflexota bacterium]